jgi:intraflagellar transport protein 52
LVLLGEGGEQQFNTNINFLLEEYGIMINNGTSVKFERIRPVCF